jgi:para-aminobenzoate synthetase / 4-amino-4-deoxychorismate lyase
VKAGFRLIETMRVSGQGEVFLLRRHLARLSRSAEFFAFAFDLPAIRDAILQAIPQTASPVCLRLLLAEDGACSVESSALPAGYFERLKLSTVRVDSGDAFLYHKTTKRGVYEQARRGYDAQTDALLSNERGEITETTIMNVAVWRDGRWLTPQDSCGLLPGVMREELLSRGEIVEGVIRVDELAPGEQIRCFNALRGIFDVRLL